VLSHYRAVGDRHEEGKVLNLLGVAHHGLNDIKKALGYYLQALPLLRAAPDRRLEALALGNIGGSYYRLGDRQKALDYYQQAPLLSRSLGDPLGQAAVLLGLGQIHEQMGERRKALAYFLQALRQWSVVRGERSVSSPNTGKPRSRWSFAARQHGASGRQLTTDNGQLTKSRRDFSTKSNHARWG
jgi:tetratricopeptide (TPR) repeat protein